MAILFNIFYELTTDVLKLNQHFIINISSITYLTATIYG